MTLIERFGPKAIVELLQGNVYQGAVSTATSTAEFASTDLAGFGNDYFVGWWIGVVWDAGGASAAPQGEYRQVTDYVSSTGTFTHTPFSAQTAVTDKITLISPTAYRISLAMPTSSSIETLHRNQQAELDFARVYTAVSPITMTGSVQTLYSNTPGRPFFFSGGFVWEASENDMGNSESLTYNVDVNTGTVGTPDWSNIWTITISGGVPAPIAIAIPSGRAEDTGLNIPVGFWNDGRGVRVTAEQTAQGDGYYSIQHSLLDGVPRT